VYNFKKVQFSKQTGIQNVKKTANPIMAELQINLFSPNPNARESQKGDGGVKINLFSPNPNARESQKGDGGVEVWNRKNHSLLM
jgi:hypothetical protein